MSCNGPGFAESRRSKRGSSTEPLESPECLRLCGEADPDSRSRSRSSSACLSSSETASPSSPSSQSAIAWSSDHSGDSSSSWKYVKLAIESARGRRCAKPVTLVGTLSDIGPAKTYKSKRYRGQAFSYGRQTSS